MSLLVVDHVAELGRLVWAVKALEKLVGAPRLLVDHIALLEAHVPRVQAIAIAHALLDGALGHRGHHARVDAAPNGRRRRLVGRLLGNVAHIEVVLLRHSNILVDFWEFSSSLAASSLIKNCYLGWHARFN